MTKTRIIEAVRNLDLASTEQILDTKPSLLTVTDRQGRNLLHLACSVPCATLGVPEQMAAQTATLLLDRGLDIEATALMGHDPCTPIFFAAARGRNSTLVKELIAQGANATGLFAAGWNQDMEILDLLVGAGATVDEVVRGGTPFMLCWTNRRFEAAKFFVRHGADVNFQDPRGKTALHYGVEKGYDPALLRFLVANGASPDIADDDGVSPKLRASRKRDKTLFEALA